MHIGPTTKVNKDVMNIINPRLRIPRRAQNIRNEINLSRISVQTIIGTRAASLCHSNDGYLYWNAVLGGPVRLSVCLCATEITFPLSNFKIKHIFGTLMALRKC